MEPNPPNLIQFEITSLTKSRKTTWWDNLFRKEKSETYRLVLDAKAGQALNFTLPIIIGHHEAMTMGVVLEGMTPKHPLTIDYCRTQPMHLDTHLILLLLIKLKKVYLPVYCNFQAVIKE